jgi:hypothetical protein
MTTFGGVGLTGVGDSPGRNFGSPKVIFILILNNSLSIILYKGFKIKRKQI